MNYDLNTHTEELRLRVARAERKATLMASLGPIPKAERVWPFRRRALRPLPGPIELASHRESRPAA